MKQLVVSFRFVSFLFKWFRVSSVRRLFTTILTSHILNNEIDSISFWLHFNFTNITKRIMKLFRMTIIALIDCDVNERECVVEVVFLLLILLLCDVFFSPSIITLWFFANVNFTYVWLWLCECYNKPKPNSNTNTIQAEWVFIGNDLNWYM